MVRIHPSPQIFMNKFDLLTLKNKILSKQTLSENNQKELEEINLIIKNRDRYKFLLEQEIKKRNKDRESGKDIPINAIEIGKRHTAQIAILIKKYNNKEIEKITVYSYNDKHKEYLKEYISKKTNAPFEIVSAKNYNKKLNLKKKELVKRKEKDIPEFIKNIKLKKLNEQKQ